MLTHPLPTVRLNDHGTKIFLRHLQTFGTDSIADIPAGLQPGECVRIVTENTVFAGIGYVNQHSRIPLRILSFDDRYPDKNFWIQSIRAALAYRYRFYNPEDSFRVVYGDADHLPGLIIDKFSDCLSVQITTAGIERYVDTILDTLQEIFQPAGIMLACDSLPRKKEGLNLFRHTARGAIPEPYYAVVDGVEHAVNFYKSHKTGFFLDHRDNRRSAARLCSGKTVLDVFCYSGSFGILAGLQDAEHVTCVDIFEPALEMGRCTAKRHGIAERMDFIRAEAFGYLGQHTHHRKWDIIFLDPPSFVRGKHRSQRNLSNYRKIATLALENLAPGGILITSCCSYHVSREDFMAVTFDAFCRHDRTCRVFHIGSQSPDHPVHPGIEGTDYLKCFFIAADF